MSATLDRYAFAHPDSGFALFHVLMSLGSWPIACASCLAHRATEAMAFVRDGEGIGYGLCPACAKRLHEAPSKSAGWFRQIEEVCPITAAVEENLKSFTIDRMTTEELESA
jgi:hypothetical protein